MEEEEQGEERNKKREDMIKQGANEEEGRKEVGKEREE